MSDRYSAARKSPVAGRVLLVTAVLIALVTLTSAATAADEFVIKNAKIMTASHGTIANGSIYVKNGKIAAVGATINAPASATVIDAGGKIVTPGLIDSHSHMALGDDINEATSPIVPHMMMIDAFDPSDKAVYRALAGGVTSALLLHGSADMIGGQSVMMKTKYGASREQMLFPDAPRIIKFASGENPKRVFGGRNMLPSTRMGNFAVLRQALQEAKEYKAEWARYNEKVKSGDKTATPPKRDLKNEALTELLDGKIMVHAHTYRADEFLTEMAIAKEYGYNLRAFVHGLEAYKVCGKLAENHVGLTTFSDWWGYKYEAWDAIPYNAVMCMRKGVVVAINSDSNDYIRRLNQEAAKLIRYGGATEDEALQTVTLNAAWMMGIQDRTGSIDNGKDADLVIWDGHPLSSYGVPNKVFIDGQLFFDRNLPGYGLTHYAAAPEDSTLAPTMPSEAKEVK
jgi:imidazolonepropionase-like amidohydrolase